MPDVRLLELRAQTTVPPDEMLAEQRGSQALTTRSFLPEGERE
jgi:hypothetical protein